MKSDFRLMLHEIMEGRELFYFLTLKEIRVKYKQSIIGIGWALLMPLISMVIFTVIFTRVAKVETDVPYPIFVYCGLLPWQLFAHGLGTATKSLVANSNLVTKVYLPREVFPFAAVVSKIVDFAIGFTFVFVLMWYYQIPIVWTIVFLPIILLVQLMFTLGLGFFASMGNLYFRDVDYLMQIGIPLWMYLTAVAYPLEVSDERLQAVLNLNPMTPIVNAYRDVLLRGKIPSLSEFGLVALVSISLFLMGWYFFHRREFRFAEFI